MPTYIWHNKVTDEYVEVTCSIANIDKFLEDYPENEHDDWRRVPQLPNVRTDKLSTSYIDGHVPLSKQEDIKDAKEAVKLEMESYNLEPKKRAGINREIKKLRSIKK